MISALVWLKAQLWKGRKEEVLDEDTKIKQKRQCIAFLTLLMYVFFFLLSSMGVRTAAERVESLNKLYELPEGQHPKELTNLLKDGQSLVEKVDADPET